MNKILNTNQWKEYIVGDIFTVERPVSRSQAEYDSGPVPFVASGNYNNGVVNYLEPKSNEQLDNGGCITVSPLDGSSFYQENDFLGRGGAGSAIIILRNKKLNLKRGLFLCSVLKKSFNNCQYSDQLNTQTILKVIIKLPCDENGEPDYQYMEQYIDHYSAVARKNIQAALDTVKNKNNRVINVAGWKKFVIGDLFEKLELGRTSDSFVKVMDTSEVRNEEFNLPLVNAKSGNNGIMYYGRKDGWEYASGCLDIVQNGAVATGDVYPQIEDTGVLFDAYLIKYKDKPLTQNQLLFFSTVLQKHIKQKFGYNDKATWDRVSKVSVLLPCLISGEPDLEFMDTYIKELSSKIQAKK